MFGFSNKQKRGGGKGPKVISGEKCHQRKKDDLNRQGNVCGCPHLTYQPEGGGKKNLEAGPG